MLGIASLFVFWDWLFNTTYQHWTSGRSGNIKNGQIWLEKIIFLAFFSRKKWTKKLFSKNPIFMVLFNKVIIICHIQIHHKHFFGDFAPHSPQFLPFFFDDGTYFTKKRFFVFKNSFWHESEGKNYQARVQNCHENIFRSWKKHFQRKKMTKSPKIFQFFFFWIFFRKNGQNMIFSNQIFLFLMFPDLPGVKISQKPRFWTSSRVDPATKTSKMPENRSTIRVKSENQYFGRSQGCFRGAPNTPSTPKSLSSHAEHAEVRTEN